MGNINQKKNLIRDYSAYKSNQMKFLSNPNEFILDKDNKIKLDEILNQIRKLSKSNSILSKNDLVIEAAFNYVYGSAVIDKIEFLLRDHGLYVDGVLIPEIVEPTQELCDFADELLSLKDESMNAFEKMDELEEKLGKSDFGPDAAYRRKLLIQKVVTVLSIVSPYKEDVYFSLLNQGYELKSAQCKELLIRFYCDTDHMDLSKARAIFDNGEIADFKDKNMNKNSFESSFVAENLSFSILFHAYMDNGYYKEAKEVAIANKKFLNRFSDDQRVNNASINELIKITDGFITSVDKKIGEATSIKLDELTLKKYFSDDAIKDMPNDVKVYVLTSIEVYNYLLCNQNSYDYSACVMPIMKAVEYLLHKIIGERYLQFLHKIPDIQYNKIPEGLKYKDYYKQEYCLTMSTNILEFGTAIHSIAFVNKSSKTKNDDAYVPNPYFLSFCKQLDIESPVSTIKHLAYVLDLVREKRNLAAHKNKVLESDAQQCKEYLLTNFKLIEYILTKFKMCLSE